MAVHAGLASGRWETLSPAEQMGNIGSEVERAIRAHRAGNGAGFERAFERALELFDLTAEDSRWRHRRLRELRRAREEFCGAFETGTPTPTAGLGAYYLAFALLARRGR
ncbi:MAG: hypothetical protein ABR559_05060 [Gemmatimonadota bacterium]